MKKSNLSSGKKYIHEDSTNKKYNEDTRFDELETMNNIYSKPSELNHYHESKKMTKSHQPKMIDNDTERFKIRLDDTLNKFR